jgi:hypothetical protein
MSPTACQPSTTVEPLLTIRDVARCVAVHQSLVRLLACRSDLPRVRVEPSCRLCVSESATLPRADEAERIEVAFAIDDDAESTSRWRGTVAS